MQFVNKAVQVTSFLSPQMQNRRFFLSYPVSSRTRLVPNPIYYMLQEFLIDITPSLLFIQLRHFKLFTSPSHCVSTLIPPSTSNI